MRHGEQRRKNHSSNGDTVTVSFVIPRTSAIAGSRLPTVLLGSNPLSCAQDGNNYNCSATIEEAVFLTAAVVSKWWWLTTRATLRVQVMEPSVSTRPHRPWWCPLPRRVRSRRWNPLLYGKDRRAELRFPTLEQSESCAQQGTADGNLYTWTYVVPDGPMTPYCPRNSRCLKGIHRVALTDLTGNTQTVEGEPMY